MEVLPEILQRRSIRAYTAEPVDKDQLERIVEAGRLAPSAKNRQEWRFVVIQKKEVRLKMMDAAFNQDYVGQAPVIIAVVGDPKKTGADMFLEGGGLAYQHGCAAAIQNMLLAAHALGLGTLWFTLFEKDSIRKTLKIDQAKEPLALICLGKPASAPPRTPRKAVKEIASFIS